MDEERERLQQWMVVMNFTAVTAFTVFAGGTMLFFSWLRFYWEKENQLGWMAAMLNALIIIVYNTAFKYIAEFITALENWRTEEQFNYSFVIKLFIFQFVNSYFTLYIVNFIKPFATRPHVDGIHSSSDFRLSNSTGGSIAGNWVADVVGMCGCTKYVPANCFQDFANTLSPCADSTCSNKPYATCHCANHDCGLDAGWMLFTIFGIQLLTNNITEALTLTPTPRYRLWHPASNQ